MSKIDYKELLDEATFKIYSDLRECRKQISEKEAVPVYAVFTNEELANIAKLDVITPSNLMSVKGIGKSKAEKYGTAMLELYHSK
jgi:superfamily II DNA helicase RecQ